jgi:hypothetical protein
MLGGFRDDARTRHEFLELIRHRGVSMVPGSSSASGTCVSE